MTTYVTSLPLDLTGISPDNLIEEEIHLVPSSQRRLIILDYGAFFKESLIIEEVGTGNFLTDSQYLTLELYQDAALKTGKEVYNVIVITDEGLESPFKITYQALGGPFSQHRQNLIDWYEEHLNTSANLDFKDVTDFPIKLSAAAHLQPLKDVFGMEYLVERIDSLVADILTGTTEAKQAVKNDIVMKLESTADLAETVTTEEILNYYDAEMLQKSKELIKLDNVANYDAMSEEEVKLVANPGFLPEQITEEKYLTLNGLAYFASALKEYLASSENTRIGVTANVFKDPSKSSFISSTAGSIFIMKSKNAAAEDSLDFDVGMYPEDIGNDEQVAVVKVSSSYSNYGGIWLGFAMNSGQLYIANLPTDLCGTTLIWNKALLQGDLTEFQTFINEHITDTKNPHDLNKKQIQLDQVENLPVVSTEEIMSDKGAYKYLTLDTLMYYTKKFLTNAKPPPLPGEEVDPNRRTMDQDAIIFTQCRKCVGSGGSEDYPPKNQLVRTWCDGRSKVIRYTDGEGGFYDQVDANSPDCEETKGSGTVLAVYCKDFDKMNTIVGEDGEEQIEVVVEINSEECGYERPPTAGTVLAKWCQGTDEMTRYADGTGGVFELLTGRNTDNCGYKRGGEEEVDDPGKKGAEGSRIVNWDSNRGIVFMTATDDHHVVVELGNCIGHQFATVEGPVYLSLGDGTLRQLQNVTSDPQPSKIKFRSQITITQKEFDSVEYIHSGDYYCTEL